MVSVMERNFSNGVTLKALNDFLIGHGKMLTLDLTLRENLLFLGTALAGSPSLDFLKPVASARVQIKTIKLLQIPNAFKGGRTKRSLSIEGMEHHALKQIA